MTGGINLLLKYMRRETSKRDTRGFGCGNIVKGGPGRHVEGYESPVNKLGRKDARIAGRNGPRDQDQCIREQVLKPSDRQVDIADSEAPSGGHRGVLWLAWWRTGGRGAQGATLFRRLLDP